MAGSDVQSTFIKPSAVSATLYAGSQSPGGAGNLTLQDPLGVPDMPRNVTITSGGDDRTATFTVTGTDERGDAQTETITGANAGAATGTKYFASVSQIAISKASAGTVTAGSGTAICGVVFEGRLRLRGMYFANGAATKTIVFNEESSAGTTLMQIQTTAGVATSAYPDIPDEGVLFKNGCFIPFVLDDFGALTLFYS